MSTILEQRDLFAAELRLARDFIRAETGQCPAVARLDAVLTNLSVRAVPDLGAPALGTVVTWECPDMDVRMIAVYAPGALDDCGTAVDCMWVDSFGGSHRSAEIALGNPLVYVQPACVAR